MDLIQFERGVFLVNVLGIVYDATTQKILIGRREGDSILKELSWCFPGGRPGFDEDLEFYLKEEIKKKTNLEVEIEKIIFAKTYPENRQLLSIYYLCKPMSLAATAGEKFVETKWISPHEVEKYFTTSIHPKVLEILKQL